MTSGAVHGYRVELQSGQFLFATVEQRGIDVVITAFGPDGERIAEFDTPNGRRGIEGVSIDAEKSGVYRLEVRPFDETAGPGRYEIEVEKLEAAATTRAGKVDQLFLAWDRPGTPGAAVAVVRDGEAVYQRAFGSANLEHDIPIEPSTVFDIASVSKQFTGLAIAMLVDRGELSLDADIREYLPEMPDFGRAVTVRHLVHHISGHRDWTNALPLAGWRFEDVISFRDILDMVRHQKDLNFEPGAEYSYSNTGYNLLAEIIARVSGVPFAEWMQENVFEPLGMTHTHFHDDHNRVVINRATSYRAHPELGLQNVANNLTALGSSSLYTTAEDLVKWVLNYEHGRVGGSAAVEMTHQQGVLNSGETIAYAFGQGIGSYRGLRTVSHGGSWAGFRTNILRFPDQRFAVIVLSNIGYFNPAGISQRIADIYLAGEFPAPEVESAPREEREEVAVDPALLDDYVGTYKLGPGWLLTITSEGGRLMAQATNEPKFPMTAVADNRFWVEDYGADVLFPRDAAGAVTHIVYRGIQAPRVELVEPSAEELEEYSGVYYNDELETTYTIVLSDGQLVAQHHKNEDQPLTPILRDEFTNPAWYLRNIAFTRGADGAVTGLLITSGRVRNLRFVRQATSR